MITKSKFNKTKVATKIPASSLLANRIPKINDVLFRQPITEKTVEFNEDDYLLIDWVRQENTKPYGKFSEKIKNRMCCWEIQYIIRTIPGVYFSTPEIEQETLRTIDTEFDEYEMNYVHQTFCDHRDIGPIMAHILNGFLDSGTHLLAAQAKLIPISIPNYLKKYGKFGTPIDSSQPFDIIYEWDPKQPLNWDFFERPLTSSPYPYIK